MYIHDICKYIYMCVYICIYTYIQIYIYMYIPKMVTFIKMVITGVENGSPDIILTAFDGKFHEKKMSYLPRPVDLQKAEKKRC